MVFVSPAMRFGQVKLLLIVLHLFVYVTGWGSSAAASGSTWAPTPEKDVAATT